MKTNNDMKKYILPTVTIVCLLIGFLIPLMIIYLKEMFYNKVRGKEDLKAVTAPFLGEIPYAFERF